MKTTAIYPNRIKDKRKIEKKFGLYEFGNFKTEFITPKGTLFAVGYSRIVYGDHGPYIEFSRRQIKIGLHKKFDRETPSYCYYVWLEPDDDSKIKVYGQLKRVDKLPNPPAGGFKGNRKEGYADYRVGKIYVSPYELKVINCEFGDMV